MVPSKILTECVQSFSAWRFPKFFLKWQIYRCYWIFYHQRSCNKIKWYFLRFWDQVHSIILICLISFQRFFRLFIKLFHWFGFNYNKGDYLPCRLPQLNNPYKTVGAYFFPCRKQWWSQNMELVWLFFVIEHINLHGLFKAKVILVECYYLSHIWSIREFIPFPRVFGQNWT